MKKNLAVLAAFCAVFIINVLNAAPAAADPAPPPANMSRAAELAGEVSECRETLAEEQNAHALTKQQLQECLAGKPITPTPTSTSQTKRRVVPVCDETAGAKPVQGPDGVECDCADARTRPVVSERRKFRSFDRLTIVCALTDLSALDDLLERLEALDGIDVISLRERITRLEEGGIVAPEDIVELEQQVADHEKRIGELERKDREENCKTDGTNCPESMVSSPNEWTLAGFGLAAIRPMGPPTTFAAGGSVGFTGWFNPNNAFQLTGLVGPGFSSDSNNAVAGAELVFVHAFGERSRVHRLQLGLLGFVEPGRDGNLGTFLGPQVAYRLVLPVGFMFEANVAVGGNMLPLRENGQLTGELSGIGVAVVPGIKLGYSFGGSPAAPSTSSSSTTTGGSVSAKTP